MNLYFFDLSESPPLIQYQLICYRWDAGDIQTDGRVDFFITPPPHSHTHTNTLFSGYIIKDYYGTGVHKGSDSTVIINTIVVQPEQKVLKAFPISSQWRLHCIIVLFESTTSCPATYLDTLSFILLGNSRTSFSDRLTTPSRAEIE